MTTAEEHNRRIERRANELAALCRAHTALEGDLPGLSEFHKLTDPIQAAIDEILDSEIDAIGNAIGHLRQDGHIDGLEELAYQLLRRKPNY